MRHEAPPAMRGEPAGWIDYIPEVRKNQDDLLWEFTRKMIRK